jgi:excisionase family DNA binding protein
MPRTKKQEPAPPQVPAPATVNGPPGDVLTLSEAAAYLRLPEADVIGLVHSQGLPGRLIGDQWRFLKAAIQQWLSTGAPTPQTRKAAQLALAGAWKDDPDLEAMVEEIYRRRGRPITEDGSYKLFHGLSPESEQK